jgi:hypothetical protein
MNGEVGSSSEERGERFLREHAERMRRVDEALEAARRERAASAAALDAFREDPPPPWAASPDHLDPGA